MTHTSRSPILRPWQIGMKTIGVLGGLGPQATMDFEARVHTVSRKLIPARRSGGYPPMLVYYYRFPPFLLGEDETPLLPLQPDSRLLDAARNMAQWANFLVITANAPHVFRAELADAFAGPVLSIVDVTLDEVRRRNPSRIGVLGLGDTRVYTGPLRHQNISTVTLPADLQGPLDTAVFSMMEGSNGLGEREAALAAVDWMRAQSVDAILLGCTELPLLVEMAAEAPDIINPAQFLAEAAVRYAISEVAVLNQENSTAYREPMRVPQPVPADR
jgi:aspartate racemase